VPTDPRPLELELRQAVRDVRDFPRPGILFRDITPLLASHALFSRTIDEMASWYEQQEITHVVGVESRGFLLAAPMALALGAALVPVRKPGKLPFATASAEYVLEYGTDRLEIHADACGHGARVVVVDDVLATGGTAVATCALVEGLGATIAGCAFLIALTELGGAERLAPRQVRSLLYY
jgi:adenine phosphoribosyltransferase